MNILVPCSNASCLKWVQRKDAVILFIQFFSHAGKAERTNTYCSKNCMEETLQKIEKNDDPMTALVITDKKHISVSPEIYGIICKHKYDLKIL